MFKPFGFGPFIVMVTLMCVGTGFYWAGYDVAKRERVDKIDHEKRQARGEPSRAEMSLEEAARIASENSWNLRVPEDRYLLSAEVSFTQSHELRYLIRLWPPWPVSRPEDVPLPACGAQSKSRRKGPAT